MKLSINIINGNDDALLTEEEKILSLFYKAFNSRNMELMERSWLHSEEISMNNPIGGIRRGWEEIKTGYDKIFNSEARVFVEFYDYSIHKTDTMFFATGKEKGFFRTGETGFDLAIRTTRIFIRSNVTWKQIHHHGSIDDSQLLKTYQEAVLQK